MGKRAEATIAASLKQQLETTRREFEVARNAAEQLANEETAHLGSDEKFYAWQRRKRIAELELDRLIAAIASLENAVATESQQRALDAYARRYDAAATRNREVAAMIRNDLAAAWATISCVLEAAALAEIESEEVRKARPAGFKPTRSLGDPESVRRQPSAEEEILSDEKTSLWVDERGHLFADQTRRPMKKASLKTFRKVEFYPARRGDNVEPFYRTLRFPRLDNHGPALFDGASLNSPADVLRALNTPRPVTPARQKMMRIEPVNAASFKPSEDDLGPALP